MITQVCLWTLLRTLLVIDDDDDDHDVPTTLDSKSTKQRKCIHYKMREKTRRVILPWKHSTKQNGLQAYLCSPLASLTTTSTSRRDMYSSSIFLFFLALFSSSIHLLSSTTTTTTTNSNSSSSNKKSPLLQRPSWSLSKTVIRSFKKSVNCQAEPQRWCL